MLLPLLALTLAACSSPATQAPGSSVHASVAAPGSALGAAQRLVFANRYQAADAAFAGLVTRYPDDARSRAWYALFLNYRHSFPAALVQARAAVRARPDDGLAQAVLCRVHDWANRLEPALSAGRRAVAVAPREPLGHLFLSEALADHGELAAAAEQLHQAEPLMPSGSSGYLRAELAREQANFAHDRGDNPAQLAALVAARDAQPVWVERLGELAQVQLQAGQIEPAHATLARAIEEAPDDPGPLEALITVALLQPDYRTASELVPRAVALVPGDDGLLDLQAQVDVASAHDLGAARQALVAALHRNPADLSAAAYLLALARYAGAGDEAEAHALIADSVARGDEPRRGGRPDPHPADPDARQTADATVALAAVNATRAQAGLAPVRLDPSLSAAASAHSWYWLFNNAEPGVAGLGIHRESQGQPGYRGTRPGDRALAASYSSGDVGEDITHRGTPAAAVADWVNSVYHRFPILRADLAAIGYGEVAVGPLAMEDMEFGFDGSAPAAAPLVYPAEGQLRVPATFVDNELPDPLPAGAARTSGYPVTITFAARSVVQIDSFTLHDATGHDLDVYAIPPSPESENSGAVLPRQPLHPGEQYSASVTASVDGRPFARSWKFTVTRSGQ
ncbi:MAG: hypothetical protein NVSMB29_03270 [Candidatus Dormibacteria bacterium]